MSYELKKPYTQSQKNVFIDKYNHSLNLQIVETETSLFALEHNEILLNNVPAINPNYEAEQKAKEQERIKSLTMTKRNFAIALRDYFQIPYQTLKQTIAQSDDAQLEWDLCVELHRNNPLLDIMAGEMGITPKQLDYIFQLHQK